ncbi:MAG: c-type cytochrome [Bacteroidota bacterium]
MKKLLPGIAFIFLLAACGGEGTKETPKEETTTKEDRSKNPDYQKGLELVGKSDCLTCHKVNEPFTGPAYSAVAERYANAADTTITRLANTIIKGGSGQWGAVPMTPHAAVSEEDAKQMVKYVLLLKN